MIAVGIVAVAVLAGCGRIGFGATGDGGGATDGANDGVGSDGDSRSGLLLHLSFDDEPASGIVNRGSLSTTIACTPMCPTLTPGIEGNAFDFDGDDDALRIADQPALHLTTGTFAAWIRPDELPAFNDYRIVMGRAFGSTGGNTWEIYLRGEAAGLTNVSFGGDASGGTYTSDQWSRGTGTWTHVAATWDGSIERLYVDGDFRSMTTQFTTSYDTHDYFVGADEENPGALMWFFDGRIDELRVYDRQLSATEIMSLVTP